MELIEGPTPPVGMLLDRIEPAMAPPLFADSAREGLRRLAPHLPPSRFLLFEHHLRGSGRLDLSIGATTVIPQGIPAPGSVRHCGPVFFEYDLEAGSTPAGLFATFSPRAPADAELLVGLAEGWLGPVSTGMKRMIGLAASSQVNDECWITHFGAMLGRPGRPARINAGCRGLDPLRAYVGALGRGTDAVAALDSLLGLVADVPCTPIAALDVTEALLPRIGLEIYLPSDPEAWSDLLSRLCARRLCTPAEAAAISGWNDEADEGGAWPEPFRSLDAFLGPASGGRVTRSINHLKLVSEADGTLRAKAYLAVRYRRGDEGSGPSSNRGSPS